MVHGEMRRAPAASGRSGFRLLPRDAIEILCRQFMDEPLPPPSKLPPLLRLPLLLVAAFWK